MEVNQKDKFICYLDILGFKNRIDESSFEKFYQKLIEEVIKPFNYSPDILYLLHDSIIIISDDFQAVVNNSFSIYSIALDDGLLLRGGLTKGKINLPQTVQEDGNRIIIPYLGIAYLKAVELEEKLNCAAICVDEALFAELQEESKKLLFSCREIFPKEGEDKKKIYLVSDMDNTSVPTTILARIAAQIPHISKHDIPKFINTFGLYYKYLRDKQDNEFNAGEALKHWDYLLETLIAI